VTNQQVRDSIDRYAHGPGLPVHGTLTMADQAENTEKRVTKQKLQK
jgi:hypothetical protein